MIRLTNAGVRLRGRWIFRALELKVERGRTVAVLGPNGCGKTTLVRTILGALALDEGRREAPAIIGYVRQTVGAEVSYEVRQVVAMGRVARRGLLAVPDRRDFDAAELALERVGMANLADRRFDRLSGGERQLVLLARALAIEATTLVLDEPSSALDLGNQERFLSVVADLGAAGDHAILFTTHLPQHAICVADEALMMFGPENARQGPVEAMLTDQHLERLYGVPMQVVDVGRADGHSARAVVPLFQGRRVA